MENISKKTLIGILGFVAVSLGIAYAVIPNDYKPNDEIQTKYDKIINELFVEIQAKSQVGQPISATVFSDLNTLFTDIVPHLPNKYSFNIIYQQCLGLSKTLAGGYNFNTLASFMDNCFKPFIKTVEEINKNYTIKAEGSIGPLTGPAPLSVTLDARASTDPSNQTIPSDNFYWYYRNNSGVDTVIGKGNVLNYTFPEAGNYKVHLTVKSSNKTTQGILDGSQTFSVDVTPRSANIVAYANGQKLSSTQKSKVGLQEGQRGIVLDGSATTAIGGRIIINHERSITGPNGFSTIRNGQGVPSTLKIVLLEQGEYTIKLTVFDNQNNKLSETFSLAISDPVAIIKQTPEQGDTSSSYTFDGSTSYSITSRLRLITREIYDNAGNKTDTLQGKSISKKFAEPGTYTVKLTVIDEQGQENTENRQVFVDSTAPIAQFTQTATADLLYPSEYILDASASSDIDKDNGFDSLTYTWEFSNPTTETMESLESGKKNHVAFNEIGKQTVTLTVVDKYGKSNSITKDFDIKSTLRPKIFTSPKATARGNQMQFVAQTNKNVLGYERNFGDGTKRTIQERNISHIYQSIGVYPVILRVQNGTDANEVKTMIFIGEKNSPIPGYIVENPTAGVIMVQDDICLDTNGNKTEIPAYRTDRYQNIIINANDSVNVKGEKDNLKMYFQQKNEQIYKDNGGKFSHKFNELGCQYVQLTVEDSSAGKNSAVKVWFKVVNALPVLDNLTLSYPQFGNDSGIGFKQAQAQTKERDIFAPGFDPLTVRVTALNAQDKDGSIAYYQWYYYYKDDPTRILGTKLSPGDIPYAFFSLARSPGEFVFGVKMYDNDGGYQRSEDIIGNGPIVFFPPDTSKPDIPIVTLKVDKNIVEVGEEVTFDVISRILSDKPNFIQERVIQYDFDGDGTWDLTSKSDRVTYTYSKPSTETNGLTPKASVVFRGYRGVGEGEKIIVKNGLKPRLLFANGDGLVLVRDVSMGDIEGAKICMDARYCDDEQYVRTKRDAGFTYTYTDYGKYVIAMDVYDKNANNVSKRRPIELSENTGTINILSVPERSDLNGNPEIFVGKNLDNSVLFYIKYNNPKGTCYIDANLGQDTNNDNNPEQDKDSECNKIFMQKYTPSSQSITGRVYYEETGGLRTQDFSISFLDFSLELDEKSSQVYDAINDVLKTLDVTKGSNQYLSDQLVALRENLIDKNDAKAIVISIQDAVTKQAVVLSANEQISINKIIGLLSDKSVSAAIGGSIYDQSKAEIISYIPLNLDGVIAEVNGLFTNFENATGTIDQSVQDIQKNILDNIGMIIQKSVAPQIDPEDMQKIIIPNLCTIATFYNIITQNCTPEGMKPIPTTVADQVGTPSGGGLAGWVKILLYIFGVLVVGFIGLVVLFAIKARMRGKSEEEEDEEQYIVEQPSSETQKPVPEASTITTTTTTTSSEPTKEPEY